MNSLEKVLAACDDTAEIKQRERQDSKEGVRAVADLACQVFGSFRFYRVKGWLSRDRLRAKHYDPRYRIRLEKCRDQWSNLLHEVAHCQVAAPSRRRMSDFGLGMTPDGLMDRPGAVPLMTSSTANGEEEYASALGILWEAHLGLDYEDTLNTHQWDWTRADRLRHIYKGLKQLGLVCTGEPVLAYRPSGLRRLP